MLLANSKIKLVLCESSSYRERENRIRQQHQDTCKNLSERTGALEKSPKTLQDISQWQFLTSISCMLRISFCSCCHRLGWLVKRFYGPMIDFCSDPSPTSFGVVLSNVFCVVKGQFPGRGDENIQHEAGPKVRHRNLIDRGVLRTLRRRE